MQVQVRLQQSWWLLFILDAAATLLVRPERVGFRVWVSEGGAQVWGFRVWVPGFQVGLRFLGLGSGSLGFRWGSSFGV